MTAVWLSERVRVEHARDVQLPGYLFVESVDDDEELWLNDQSFRIEVADALAWAERVVRKLLAPPHVYVLRFGESGGRMHFHVIPRTQAVLDGYLVQNQDVVPYNGARIAAWLWQNSSTLGYTPKDIEAFLNAARREVSDRADR